MVGKNFHYKTADESYDLNLKDDVKVHINKDKGTINIVKSGPVNVTIMTITGKLLDVHDYWGWGGG